MFELKQHLEEVFTEVFDFLLLQETGIVIVRLRKLSPLEEVLLCLAVLFDREPDTDQNEVLVVCVLRLWLLLADDRVAPAVHQFGALLCQSVV